MAKVLRTEWYGETVKALQINGKSRRTQECYARAVRMLTEYSGKEPDEITEEEIRDYFLYRKNECGWVPDTMKICYCGILFFYGHAIRRDRHIFNFLKSEKEKRLPCVLSREEVYDIPSHVRTFHNYTYLATVYACGLRLQEALYLQVSDTDNDRMQIHVHRGKGAGDRYVPCPKKPCICSAVIG
jgi:integrase